MRTNIGVTALGLALLASSACAVSAKQHEVYQADLVALNSAKAGATATGTATIEVVGSRLKVHIKMAGTPPNMQHWEHFHGYPDGKSAACATSAQDANHDGYVDLVETGAVSGTTMVPFDGAPEKMNIPNDSYPNADSSGSFDYTKTVPLQQLRDKFASVYSGGKLDLDKRVIYVHGVVSTNDLPSTVDGHVGPYDPHVTLPIACGKIRRVR